MQILLILQHTIIHMYINFIVYHAINIVACYHTYRLLNNYITQMRKNYMRIMKSSVYSLPMVGNLFLLFLQLCSPVQGIHTYLRMYYVNFSL